MAGLLRRVVVQTLATLIGLNASYGFTAAQDAFPNKAVRIILGVPAGGVSDTLARGLSQELSKKWGQSVVVENRPGGSGVIATTAVTKAAADGSMILMANSVQLITTPLLLANPPYDPAKDLTAAVGLVRIDDVLLASLQSNAKTVQDLIALARAKPGQLNYGSFGPGSASHLDAESFCAMAGIQATHIPYKGGPEVLQALLTGHIDFAFTGLTPAIPLVKENKVTALGYSGAKRTAVLPDVPTLSEQGLKVAAGGWFAWLVPAGTPKSVVDKIAADASEVLAQPAFRARFVTGVGLEPLSLPPDEIEALLRADVATYVSLVKSLNLKPQ